MTLNETYQEIVSITQMVIEHGLSIAENHPIRVNSKISWTNQGDISIALKNIPYSEKYDVLRKDDNFNFLMVDGALIQMMYEYNKSKRKLISHRLTFFPSPSLKRYDNHPEFYEKYSFGNSEFHDMIERNTVTFPIRFDYNIRKEMFTEIDHPYSHVSFGEYEYCRIPVIRPLSPGVFIEFILRNFYNYALHTKNLNLNFSAKRFKDTITENEAKILHFNFI